jgi:hypothetical protein
MFEEVNIEWDQKKLLLVMPVQWNAKGSNSRDFFCMYMSVQSSKMIIEIGFACVHSLGSVFVHCECMSYIV